MFGGSGNPTPTELFLFFMSKTPLIEFKNVVKSFGDKLVLDGMSFQVFEGETFCIIGGSGSGKSVTLKLLLGLMPIDEGEIYFKGEPISGLSEDELCRIRPSFGMVFQGAALFDSLTVFENVAYPLQEVETFSDEQIEQRVLEKLKVVGLEKTADLFPSDLSGGMLKRVGLARALATNPQVVLYDEPTAGLDPSNVNRINDLMLTLQKKFSVTSILVTHNMESVFKVANRVALLYQKRADFVGTLAEFRSSNNELTRKFLAGEIGGN